MINHNDTTKVSDQCLIDIDPSVFAIWNLAMIYRTGYDAFNHLFTTFSMINYNDTTKVSDQCLIDIDPSVFAICNLAMIYRTGYDAFNHLFNDHNDTTKVSDQCLIDIFDPSVFAMINGIDIDPSVFAIWNLAMIYRTGSCYKSVMIYRTGYETGYAFNHDFQW